MPQQVDGDTAEQRERRHQLELGVDVGERLLQAEGEQHDPGHHRQVEVVERVARELVALLDVDARQPALGRDRDDVEVEPPEARHRREPHEHSDHRADVVQLVAHADAERDERLAERDDHDEAVPLGEVVRAQLPPLGAGDERCSDVDRDRDRPEQAARPPGREEGCDEDERRPEEQARRQPRHSGADIGLVAADHAEEHHVGDAHREVRDAEEKGLVARSSGDVAELAECSRRGERGQEHRAHRREHDEAGDPVLGVGGRADPDVGDPGPPQHGENGHAAQQPEPGGIRGHQRRHLGQ